LMRKRPRGSLLRLLVDGTSPRAIVMGGSSCSSVGGGARLRGAVCYDEYDVMLS
jgi:hypothetical protein